MSELARNEAQKEYYRQYQRVQEKLIDIMDRAGFRVMSACRDAAYFVVRIEMPEDVEVRRKALSDLAMRQILEQRTERPADGGAAGSLFSATSRRAGSSDLPAGSPSP